MLPQGTLGDVCKHFWLSRPGGIGCCWRRRVGAKHSCNGTQQPPPHPTNGKELSSPKCQQCQVRNSRLTPSMFALPSGHNHKPMMSKKTAANWCHTSATVKSDRPPLLSTRCPHSLPGWDSLFVRRQPEMFQRLFVTWV